MILQLQAAQRDILFLYFDERCKRSEIRLLMTLRNLIIDPHIIIDDSCLLSRVRITK